MQIKEVNEELCRDFLARASFGRLGCSLNNQPYVVPVCFSYEADYIYVFSTVGKKIEVMRANPNVCLQTDELVNTFQWISVIANGQYEELPEIQFAAERRRARQLLEKRNLWWVNAIAVRRIKTADEFVAPLFFRIHVLSLTGLSAIVEGEEAA
jgi:nitroimidazol reductase NimA-like FMN-containing flavoprotein (pyridoxamine 5'-phosphate oxidase superfamily)